jgi:hypothetical protein
MDLRYALRMLSRAPGFTAVAVLTLALGIGINTVVFTLYTAVALKPIAAHAPQELVRISGHRNGELLEVFSYEQYDQIHGQAQSFSDVLASSGLQTLGGRMPVAGPQARLGETEVLHVRLVSDNYFSALGVIAPDGRGFLADDRDAVVLSYEFWRRRFESDPAVLTRTIQVQGVALHVVGVTPPKFAGTGSPPQMPDMWIPLAAQALVLPGVDWLHDRMPSCKCWRAANREFAWSRRRRRWKFWHGAGPWSTANPRTFRRGTQPFSRRIPANSERLPSSAGS